MRHFSFPRVAGAALILLIAAACAPASDQPSAEQALCDSMAAFRDSVQTVADFQPATDSLEDLEADRDAAAEAWDQVKADAADVADADEAALETAWTELVDSITDLPTDVPLADVKFIIDEAAADVIAVYDEMRDGLGCDA